VWAASSANFSLPITGNRMTVGFPGYNRAEVLTNIPLLVRLGTNIPGFTYANFLSPTGGDLRLNSADGGTDLNFEIESWNTNGASFVWVQVPALASNTTIRATWGSPGATNLPPSSTNGATWSNGHVGIYHVNATNVTDSAASPQNASTNTATATGGIVGGALNFDGVTNTTAIPHNAKFNLATNFEIQCWFKLAAADKPAVNNYRTLTSKEIDLNDRNWWIAIRSDGQIWWKSSTGIDTTNSTDVADGAWHMMSAVHDGSTARLYVDGALAATDTTPGAASTQISTLYFGSETGNTRFFKGPLDEFRFSNVPRSSNWVWAVYQNIAANAAFTSFAPLAPPATPVASQPTLTNGVFSFQISGDAGVSYTVQASTNLTAWINLFTTNVATMPFTWSDSSISNFAARF
jgi:hypothetical protein